MAVLTFGINKGQKKFAPKVRAKQVRRPLPSEATDEVSEAAVIEDVIPTSPKEVQTVTEPSVTPTEEELSPRDETTFQKPETSVASVPNNLVSHNSLSSGSLLTPPNSQLIEQDANPKPITAKKKGKGIAILTPVASQSQTYSSQTETSKEYSDPNKLVDIMELVQKVVQAKIAEKKAKREANSSPALKSPVESKIGGVPTVVSGSVNAKSKSSTLGTKAGAVKPAVKRTRKASPNANDSSADSKKGLPAESEAKPKRRRKTVSPTEEDSKTSAADLASLAATDPTIEKTPRAPKVARGRGKTSSTVTHRAILEAINGYQGSSRLNLDPLPLSVLCNSNITYGEEMPEELKPKLNTTPREPHVPIKAPRPAPTRPAGSNNMAVQVKLINGVLQVDEDSQQIALEEFESYQDSGAYEVIEEGNTGRYINCMTYVKRTASIRWSKVETDLFYKALIKWGSDFEMIAKEFFPHRERKQIRHKFKREENQNPSKIKDALLNRVYVPL